MVTQVNAFMTLEPIDVLIGHELQNTQKGSVHHGLKRFFKKISGDHMKGYFPVQTHK